MDGIHNRVAADRHPVNDLLAGEVLPVALGRGEMQRRNLPDQAAVDLLWEGGIFIVGAQPGLDVADRDLMVKRRERACKGGRGVAVHQHNFGLGFQQDVVQPAQRFFGDGGKRLALLHNIEVKIRFNLKNIQHLVEHFPVLRGHADNGFGVFAACQLVHQRGHFNRFRAGAENGHYFNLLHVPVPFRQHRGRAARGCRGYKWRRQAPTVRQSAKSSPSFRPRRSARLPPGQACR